MIGILRGYAHVRRLLGGTPRPSDQPFRGRRVVFTMLRGHVKHVWDIEYYLAALLARAGAAVTFVVDDGVFQHLESLQHAPGRSIARTALNPWYTPKGRAQLAVLRTLNRLAYGPLDVRFLPVSRIAPRDYDGPPPARLETEPYAKDAVSSTKRFFQVGLLDIARPELRRYFDLSLMNAHTSWRVGRHVAEELRPDLVISSHGIYSTWGPSYDELRRQGTPVLIYGIHPYVPQSVQLSEEVLQLTDVDRDLQAALRRPLTAAERETAEAIIASRASHRAHDTRVYYRDAGAFGTALPADLPRPVFGIFPSVVWDGDIEERNRLFAGMYEWLRQTIRYFIAHPAQSLVIRFHPSESTLETTSVPLQRLVAEEFPDLARHRNIHVIPSDAIVDSYALLRNQLDIALVYDGVLGLEAPLLGRPTVLAGRGRFSGIDVCVEPATIEAYLEVLGRGAALAAEWNGAERREHALKALHWLMVEGAYLMPTVARDVVISSVARRPTNLGTLTAEDFDPSRSAAVARMLEKVARAMPAPGAPVR